MGDGSLVLLPTPGHTAGSMSLLVRRTGRPPLLQVSRDRIFHIITLNLTG
jgi:glyoxylase-like metal-dependent hydrolase (beta-lactamase superfamily II)